MVRVRKTASLFNIANIIFYNVVCNDLKLFILFQNVQDKSHIILVHELVLRFVSLISVYVLPVNKLESKGHKKCITKYSPN
jgi:hypothetical protein